MPNVEYSTRTTSKAPKFQFGNQRHLLGSLTVELLVTICNLHSCYDLGRKDMEKSRLPDQENISW